MGATLSKPTATSVTWYDRPHVSPLKAATVSDCEPLAQRLGSPANQPSSLSISSVISD